MTELPFTIDQFLQVFEAYNHAIWPAQLIAYMLGAGVLWFIIKQSQLTERYVNITLGGFWIWMGTVYHIIFFAEINPVAYIFGLIFILQGIAFIALSFARVKFSYAFRKNIYGITGLVFIFYAMIAYPLLGYLLGHTYPQSPIFGVAPCPTTIFTFGILLQAKKKIPVWLIVIPGLWSLVGFSAAYQLTIYEDMGLVVAGILGVSLLLMKNHKMKTGPVYRSMQGV